MLGVVVFRRGGLGPVQNAPENEPSELKSVKVALKALKRDDSMGRRGSVTKEAQALATLPSPKSAKASSCG